MAGRESHFLEAGWVPCAHQDAATLRIFLEFLDAVGQLIYTLAFVVVVHSLILCTEVTPLESVYWAQIPFLSILQPDVV
jgi:hypothetical protein